MKKFKSLDPNWHRNPNKNSLINFIRTKYAPYSLDRYKEWLELKSDELEAIQKVSSSLFANAVGISEIPQV